MFKSSIWHDLQYDVEGLNGDSIISHGNSGLVLKFPSIFYQSHFNIDGESIFRLEFVIHSDEPSKL